MGNSSTDTSKRKKAGIAGIVIAVLIAFAAVSFLIFISRTYNAEPTAEKSLISDEAVQVSQTAYGWYFDGPSTEQALLFFPGARVDETAYAPLLHKLAARGMDACLIRVPLRLAILHRDTENEIMSQYDYRKWYIGGHSLGGVHAASYAAKHPDGLSGGNHAQFGCYGDQRGDGAPSVTAEEQQDETVELILKSLNPEK